METISGMSPDLMLDSEGYSNSGGISLFSAGESGDTITGGSGNDGSYETSSRIYWTITRISNGDGSYDYIGGITEAGWFFNDPNSPFYPEPYNSAQEIWNIASRDGNLNMVFQEWNADTTADGNLKRVNFLHKIGQEAPNCYSVIAG